MSDLSEAIDEERRRSPRTPRMTRKARRALQRGTPSKPGGIDASCGCRFARTGDAWRHIWPCRSHKLGAPLTDAEMKFLMEEE